MPTIRCLLVPLTVAWLSLHVLMTTGPTILAFAFGMPADIVCTCAHGADHGSCPMHGKSKDSTRCRLEGAQEGVALSPLFVLGPLVLSHAVDYANLDAPSRRLIGYVSPFPSDWIVPPEPPPPRS